MKTIVKDLDGKNLDEIELNDSIFSLDPRSDIIKRVVDWQLLSRMRGTSNTKLVSDISGTTKKPFKQKGTGNARQGSLRSAQMRGGGVAHGPVVRSHAIDLTKKFKKNGLKHAISSKSNPADSEAKSLTILDKLALASPKTKELASKIKSLCNSTALIIFSGNIDNNFALALRNIPGYKILPVDGMNVYDIIKYDHLLIEKNALAGIEDRLL